MLGSEIKQTYIFALLFILTLTMPKFLKWNNPPSIFGTVHYHFRDIKTKTQSWSANSIEPGLALNCWQRLITFGVGRIRVKGYFIIVSLNLFIISPTHNLFKSLRSQTSLLLQVSKEKNEKKMKEKKERKKMK